MPALQVFAGPRARTWLRERGLRPQDVQAVPAAAGGPKGLVLNPIDRFLFGHWLRQSDDPVSLLGASIGAWRMASACLADPDVALARLAEDYIGQRYEHRPGKPPAAAHVSQVFGAKLAEHFGGREAEVVGHRRYRLQVFTSRGRGPLARDGAWRTPLGFGLAYLANAVARPALGTCLERVVFGDPAGAPPIDDLRSRQVPLTAANLLPAILASCSIPVWLDAVNDIPGGPPGAYWDGGITDYHLRLDFAGWLGGLVLYPHFQPTVVPGWLDKSWRWRHRAAPGLDNVVLLVPDADWIRSLPNGKLPDRTDFKAYVDDQRGREAVWRRAVAESQRLAEDLERLTRLDSVDALPLP